MRKTNLAKEIHNFRENEKTNIHPEMFVLWEYKLYKTKCSKSDIYGILKNDNVYLRLDENMSKNIQELNEDEFYLMLKLYKHKNILLNKFISRLMK